MKKKLVTKTNEPIIWQINLVQKDKSRRIKNVEIYTVDEHNELLCNVFVETFKKSSWFDRLFKPSKIFESFSARLNMFYMIRLTQNVNKSKKKK